jgi:hypothetical protein
MKPVTIHAAKTHLSRLIERVCAGEEVVREDLVFDGLGVRRLW